MNRGKHILFWGLCVLAIVGLTGCITAMPPSESPPAVTPTPEPSSSLPKSLEEMTDQDIRDQITVLECPTEARVGEYITVRLKIGSYEFWDWIRQELFDRGEYDSVWLDPFFTLYLQGERLGIAYFGKSELDVNYEALWYAAIPDEDDLGDPIKPGVYPLIVEIGEALGSVDAIFERNIIIKE